MEAIFSFPSCCLAAPGPLAHIDSGLDVCRLELVFTLQPQRGARRAVGGAD
jgi:hypothetical protein